MNGGEDMVLRLIALYGAQIGLSIIFAINFFYFSKVYARTFLSKWSVSWLGHMLLCLGMAYVTLPEHVKYTSGASIVGTVFHMTGAFLQAAFLILGTYELVHNSKLKAQWTLIVTLVTITAAMTLSFVYAFDPSKFIERYVIRIGLRCLIVGASYVACGFFAIFSRRFGLESYGKKLLGIAFVVYGIAQIIYFLMVIMVVAGHNVKWVLSLYGILDLFLMTLMGLGMVMWLLEDEGLKLKNANSDLDRFLYSTSHDLRAPIASVLGLTNLAKLDTKDQNMLNYFAMIEARVKKLDEVISDILSYSKNSKKNVENAQIYFNQLLDEVIADLKFSEGASKIKLIFDRSLKHETRSDATQLTVILNNLIANAIKYHDLEKPEPYIKVEFSRKGKEVTISIIDNGKGIAPEHLGKIFDMFYRASTDSDGSGLGLFIVKEAAAKINGTVTVESKRGEGSRFILTYIEMD